MTTYSFSNGKKKKCIANLQVYLFMFTIMFWVGHAHERLCMSLTVSQLFPPFHGLLSFESKDIRTVFLFRPSTFCHTKIENATALVT